MRTRNAALNLISSLLRNFFGMLLGMIATPIILSHLGEEKFGTLRVLLDWFGHLSLVEMGLYAALVSFMVKALGEKKGGMGEALRLSFVKYRNVALLQIAAIAIFCIFFERLVPVSPALQKETWISFFIISSTIFFAVAQIFKAQLEASQRGYLVSYVMMLQNFVYVATSIFFVFQGWSLVGQASAYAGSIALSCLIYVWLCRDQLSHFKEKSKVFAEEAVFAKQRMSLFITEVCSRASFMSDNLMITFVLGTKEVTAFFITQRLIQILQAQLQNVGGAAAPALGELFYHNEMVTFRQRVIQLTELIAFFAGVGLSVLIVLNPGFITLWTGDTTFAGPLVSSIAAINSGIFALISFWNWCFSVTNRTHQVTKIFVGHALVNVTLSYVLTREWGVVGPLVASLVAYILVMIGWMSYELCKTFSITLWKFHRAWMVPFIPPVTIAIAAVYTWGYPLFGDWWRLLLSGSMASIFVFGTCYLFLLSRETKTFLILRLKSSKYFKK